RASRNRVSAASRLDSSLASSLSLGSERYLRIQNTTSNMASNKIPPDATAAVARPETTQPRMATTASAEQTATSRSTRTGLVKFSGGVEGFCASLVASSIQEGSNSAAGDPAESVCDRVDAEALIGT